MTMSLESPRRWGFLDPYVPIVGVVSLVTFALHGVTGSLSRDLSVYTYAGQQVVDGHPPYLGILNRAGPLAHLAPALGVWHRADRRDRRPGRGPAAVHGDLGAVRLHGVPARPRPLRVRPRRAGHGGDVPELPGLHRVRLERSPREDPDDAVHPAGAVGDGPPAVVRRGPVREPGHPDPADRVLRGGSGRPGGPPAGTGRGRPAPGPGPFRRRRAGPGARLPGLLRARRRAQGRGRRVSRAQLPLLHLQSADRPRRGAMSRS